MKKLTKSSRRTKLVMHRETIARLTSEQFGKIVGGVGRDAVGTIVSDVIGCDPTSEMQSGCG
jgi:hypothetical protein